MRGQCAGSASAEPSQWLRLSGAVRGHCAGSSGALPPEQSEPFPDGTEAASDSPVPRMKRPEEVPLDFWHEPRTCWLFACSWPEAKACDGHSNEGLGGF